MIIDQLSTLVDDAASFEPWSLTSAEVREMVSAVHRTRTALDALASRLVGTAESMGLPADDGASSATAWLAQRTGIAKGDAARLVGMSRMTSHRTAATREAWAAGELSTEQAAVIMRAIDKLPDEIDDADCLRAELHLIALADAHTLDDLRRLANHIREVIDPDGAEAELGRQLEAEEKRAWDATRFEMRSRHDGTHRAAMIIPDAYADTLRAALEGIAAPRRAQLNADRHGLAVDAFTALPHARKMGLAFLELIEHLPSSSLPQSGGLAATVSVNIDLEALRSGVGTATNSSGTTVSAATAQRMACNAHLVAIFLDGDSRPADLGRSQRLFGRHQRLALAARDGGCVWAGCDRPPSWCEAHHLTFWSGEGAGPTDLDNGALLCHFHHHLLHQGEWSARMAPDGVVEIIPPRSVDPAQEPRRHARFPRPARAA